MTREARLVLTGAAWAFVLGLAALAVWLILSAMP